MRRASVSAILSVVAPGVVLSAGLGALISARAAAASGSMVQKPAAMSASVLTATAVRIGEHPAFVRAVVDFTGGSLAGGDVEATDPTPFDGRGALRVSRPGVRTTAPARGRFGASVRVVQGAGRLTVVISAARKRFKYLSYAVVGGDRLAIDLWKSAPPSRAAEIRRGVGGCLTLASVRVTAGTVSASGSARGGPEGRFVVVVRGADGGVLGQRAMAGVSGTWRTKVRYGAQRAQQGTVEAAAASLKDGALACLVQMRVALPASRKPAGGVIRPWRWGINYLGSWHVGATGNGTYPAAVRALGKPTTVKRLGRGTCIANWRGLGLEIRFTTFGAANGCKSLFAQDATISGSAGRGKWRTTKGVRVGDPLTKLDRLHPHAIRKGNSRVIAYDRDSPYGTGRLDLITAVISSNGRIAALKLFIGAAGD